MRPIFASLTCLEVALLSFVVKEVIKVVTRFIFLNKLYPVAVDLLCLWEEVSSVLLS